MAAPREARPPKAVVCRPTSHESCERTANGARGPLARAHRCHLTWTDAVRALRAAHFIDQDGAARGPKPSAGRASRDQARCSSMSPEANATRSRRRHQHPRASHASVWRAR
ncbi:Hypothetical protein A7982_08308 [Minicystis rosea]|nr:Hypothetical protein A7982_08308 [Minicystis rosea]